jgi:hypothetical protein
VAANTGILVILGRFPALDVTLFYTSVISLGDQLALLIMDTHLSVDELQVTRALRITVAGSVLGTSLVAIVLGEATVGVHGNEVQSSVESTRKTGGVHIESELLVKELEHLVGVVILHEEHARTDIGTGYEAQGQRVATGSGAIGAFIVGTIDSTVGSTSFIIRAESSIPLLQSQYINLNAHCIRGKISYGVTSVTVVSAIDRVSPTPVGINDNGAGLLSAAASGSALLPGQRRVSLSFLRASLLSTNSCRQGSQKEGALVHRCEEEGSGLRFIDDLFSGLQLKNKKHGGV